MYTRRLPEVFCDAKELLEKSFVNSILVLSSYSSVVVNTATVEHINVHNVDNMESIGTVLLDISYKERVLSKSDKFETRRKTNTFMLLNPKGDILWPHIMVSKVWGGEYPSCVAVNKDNGVVYFMYIKAESVTLVEFALLTQPELRAIVDNLNDTRPYRIGLVEDAMFQVLAGTEGSRHLKNNVYIEFDTGSKFRVKNLKSSSVFDF